MQTIFNNTHQVFRNNFENLLNGIEDQLNKKEEEEIISMKEKLFIGRIARKKELVRIEKIFLHQNK